MEDRRKIVIPLGSEPETPHFDAEETLLSARPVVPIAHVASAEVFNRRRDIARAPFYRRPAFLSLIVIAAIGIGLAAGLGIARYRYLQGPSAPVVAQPAQPPAVNDTRTATVQTPKDNQQAQVATLPEVKTEEKTVGASTVTEDSAGDDASEKTTKAPESSKGRSAADDKEDNAKTVTPAPRDKKRASDDEEADDAPRAQKRERRVRDRDDEQINIPRRIERASEQINRIREIFEGSQQRP